MNRNIFNLTLVRTLQGNISSPHFFGQDATLHHMSCERY